MPLKKPRFPRRSDIAGTYESLMRRGIKTLELGERTDRDCTNCGRPFQAFYVPQTVCAECVLENVRYTEEQARDSRAEERRRQLLTIGLDGRLASCTFESFADAEQPEAAGAARAFVTDWPGSRTLALLGERGSGKTHLAVAILHAIAHWGEDGRYIYWPGLVADVAMDWDKAAGLLKPLSQIPLLVLDDVGRERVREDSTWPMTKDRLFDDRAVRGFPTIFCSNLTRDAFGSWLGDAGFSRIWPDAVIVQMRPGDRRLTRPKAQPKPESMRDVLTACSMCAGAGWVEDGDLPVGHKDRLRKCPSCDGRRY